MAEVSSVLTIDRDCCGECFVDVGPDGRGTHRWLRPDDVRGYVDCLQKQIRELVVERVQLQVEVNRLRGLIDCFDIAMGLEEVPVENHGM